MKQLLILIISLCGFSLYGQNGGVTVSSSTSTDDGTIRYQGGDFEGRKAGTWTTLTGAGGGSSPWSTLSSNVFYNLGRVGIGTNTPLSTLHVASPNVSGGLKITRAGSSVNLDFKANISEASLGTTSNHALRFLSNNNVRMTLATNGFLGLGTTTPSKNLDLGANGADIRFSNSNFSSIQWYEGSSEVAYLTHNDNDLILQNKDSGKLEIEAETGNIDLKTSANSVLNVIGGDAHIQEELYVGESTLLNNTWTVAHFQNPISGVGSGIFLQSADSGFTGNDGLQISLSNGASGWADYRNREAGGHRFYTESNIFSPRMLVTNDGEVVIGRTTPAAGYLLSVNGKIMCEELQVQLDGNWPDYVFSDNYKLRSIYSLEKYINQNKHLPNIPPAENVEEEGISIGEMQRKMMEKIEELTLYTIQQQKEIDELKSQLNQKSK